MTHLGVSAVDLVGDGNIITSAAATMADDAAALGLGLVEVRDLDLKGDRVATPRTSHRPLPPGMPGRGGEGPGPEV